MKRLKFKDFRELLWLLVFFAAIPVYFVLSHCLSDFHIIHVALDDVIPFIPAFILPYVCWYLYMPGMLLYAYCVDRVAYRRMLVSLLPGIYLCMLGFILYPTCVDFRPEAGQGFFGWICGIIFSSDRPVNVFPSLHCFETLVLHLAGFTCPRMKAHRAARIVSAVLVILICASTVFVKQHSIADVAAGVALATLMTGFTALIARRVPRLQIKNDAV